MSVVDINRSGSSSSDRLVSESQAYVSVLQRRMALRRQAKAASAQGQRNTPEQTMATHSIENWSMDFMADQLLDGRRFQLLTIVDDFKRESLAIEVGQRLAGDDVARVLD